MGARKGSRRPHGHATHRHHCRRKPMTMSGDLPTPPPPPPDGGEETAPGARAPAGSLRFQFARSSGPGGQNVNKLNTKAELWLGVAALTGISPRALDRLRALAGKQ